MSPPSKIYSTFTKRLCVCAQSHACPVRSWVEREFKEYGFDCLAAIGRIYKLDRIIDE